jgi:DNA modification methylase
MTDAVLAKLETARTALAEAKTIQETKNILDVAVAAETYAKRQKLGEEAVQYATSIKVEALRQLGNMLKETPLNSGARGYGKSGITNQYPTLAEMGLDAKTSKLAQDIAELPDEEIEKVKSGAASLHEAQKSVSAMRRYEQRAEIAAAGASVMLSDRWNVYHGDIRTWKAPRQYDFIITDPPYPKEFLPLWEVLAERANEWLKEGGLLIAMSGQSYLDEIYAMMSKHMEYYWTASYLTPGQPTPLRQVNVNSTWKPLLIYSKGKYTGKIFGDVFVSPGNDKENHKWGQSEGGMFDIVSKICLPGQTILDPFCGAGTTLLAGIKHGCLCDGLELELENVNISKGRLAE